MLAVVILGLGILGLSALFAGAARQQQTSGKVVQSVGIGLNAKASLFRRMGSVQAGNATQLDADLPEGQWAWIRAHQSDIPMDPTLRLSTISPTAYFAAPAVEFTLYSKEADQFTGGAPSDAAGIGAYFEGSNAPPFGNIATLPHERVINTIDTPFRIQVTVTEAFAIDGERHIFLDPAPRPVTNQASPGDVHWLYLNGDPSDPAYIRVVLEPATGNARILSFDLSSLVTTSQQWISKIEALPYFWKSTDVLSLNERLTYVNDGRFPPAGYRPELGFTLFFRQLGEINQMIILTYSLQPESRPNLDGDQFPLIPPDHLPPDDSKALVREMQVDIGWDDVRNQYFVRVDQDDSWVAAPGQILLMSSKVGTGNGGSDLDKRGADSVVRVISQSPDPNPGRVRGYLNDAPRVNLTAVTPQRANAVEQVYVYAIQPMVENADPADTTRWRVRPVDARLVPIAIQ